MISDKFEQFFNAGLIIESLEDASSGIVALLLCLAFTLPRSFSSQPGLNVSFVECFYSTGEMRKFHSILGIKARAKNAN
jgi:hypothetical protein